MSKIYRLYIDESGDHTYGKKELAPFKVISKGVTVLETKLYHYPELEKTNVRYLGLTGILIEKEHYENVFKPDLEELKRKHFNYDPDEPVIFHRKELINKKGPFWRLRDSEKEQEFNADFLSYLKKCDYKVSTFVIDKKSHLYRYNDAYNPYNYGLMVLLERYCGFLKIRNAKGDVMAESRGGAEDKLLKAAYITIYNEGTHYHPAELFQKHLTSKEIKLKPKEKNIAGLQVADLIAYPSKQEILSECLTADEFKIEKEDIFGKNICDVIRTKYNRGARGVYGIGKIFKK